MRSGLTPSQSRSWSGWLATILRPLVTGATWPTAKTTSAGRCATGHPDDALKSHFRALEIRELLARDNPTVTDYQQSLAVSHINIGNLLGEMGRRDDALKSYRRSLEIGEPLGDNNPTVADYQSSLALSHNNIGLTLSATGHPDDAQSHTVGRWKFEEAGSRQLHRHRLPEQPGHQPHCYRRSAGGHGPSRRCLESYHGAMEIRERLARDNPTVTDYQSNLAVSHHNLGVTLHVAGHPEDGR